MNAPTTKLTFNRRNLRDRDHGGDDVITNDNLHLSTVKMEHQIEPFQPIETAKSMSIAGAGDDATVPQTIADYVAAATADNTRRAYQNDLRMFLTWGGVLPSSPEVVAEYLVTHATLLSPVTLSRRLVAIGRAHTTLGHPNPCRTEIVRTTLRGIWRVHGRPQRQVQPAIREDVLSMLPHMTGTRGIRDRALILIGFAGAFRRSELVALQYDDVAFVKEGLTT